MSLYHSVMTIALSTELVTVRLFLNGWKLVRRNKVDKIINWLKNNKLESISVVALVFYFYCVIVNVGISSHDELLNLYQARIGTFFGDVSIGRFGMALMNTIPSYIQSLSNSIYVYRLFTLFGLLVSCITFIWMINKLTENKTGILFFLLFFLFAQVELEHDGLFTFSFCYQINIALLFSSLAIYIDYLNVRKKHLLIASAILYLLGSMAYEAFVLYGILFLIVDIKVLKEKNEINIKQIYSDLVLHASLVILYVCLYFSLSYFTSVDRGDAYFSTTTITLKGYLFTLLKLCVGLFPLRYRPYTIIDYLKLMFHLDINNMFRWFFVVMLVFCFRESLKKTSPISNRNYGYYSCICIAGIVLPNLLVACIKKFYIWLYQERVGGYATSYYSYFFIIIWIVITCIYIYHKAKDNHILDKLLCFCIAIVTSLTMHTNDFYLEMYKTLNNKYELYYELVETDYFSTIEANAEIYAPQYFGIHYDINTLAVYANSVTGFSLIFANKENQLDYMRPVYLMELDENSKSIYLMKLNNDKTTTDEIYVYSLESLENYGFLATSQNNGISNDIYVNGKYLNTFEKEIRSDNLKIKSREMIINGADIDVNSFELYIPLYN